MIPQELRFCFPVSCLTGNAVSRLRSVSFLVLRTSPGNFQAWIALADGYADLARQVRKGTSADLTASGATRMSGSINFKEKYRPAFPVVETVQFHPGKVVTWAELEAVGMVSPAERPVPGMTPSDRRRPETKGWPSYRRCLENAPMVRGGDRTDVSRADFTFCLLAIDWGRNI